MSKLLELKPDSLGGLPEGSTADEAEKFNDKFRNRYRRFRKGVGPASTGSRIRRHRVGDVGEASQGSRGARWQDLRWAKPMCTWQELHRGEGPKSRVASVGHHGGFPRARQHGPDANPARSAGGDNS